MILERIKQYIDLKGISVSAFERSIGMSNASFGKSLKNGGAIGSDKLENILKTYPDISPSWLMTGVGEMLISKENINSSEQSQGNDERYVMHLMDKIASQAEEIGRLKERNKQLERENMELRTISNSNLTPPRRGAGLRRAEHSSKGLMEELPPFCLN